MSESDIWVESDIPEVNLKVGISFKISVPNTSCTEGLIFHCTVNLTLPWCDNDKYACWYELIYLPYLCDVIRGYDNEIQFWGEYMFMVDRKKPQYTFF